MLNQVALAGRLTRDPDLRTTSSGKSVCNFTLAVPRKRAQGSDERETDFIQIVCWQNTAELCAKHLRKGSQATVGGSIQTRNYEDNSGNKRYVTEIVANIVEFAWNNESRESKEYDTDTMQEIDDDLPF